uniref:Uncharacterized protein n=1 Tax=Oryza glumipatula TaxID=40148 RepID=A0A0D9ZAE8_9ORYZ
MTMRSPPLDLMGGDALPSARSEAAATPSHPPDPVEGKVVGGDAVASVMTVADQAEAMESMASTGDGGLPSTRSSERGAVVAPTLSPPLDSAIGKAAGCPPPDLVRGGGGNGSALSFARSSERGGNGLHTTAVLLLSVPSPLLPLSRRPTVALPLSAAVGRNLLSVAGCHDDRDNSARLMARQWGGRGIPMSGPLAPKCM